MDMKNLMAQATNSVNHTTGELPSELIELSEEDLQEIVGGNGGLVNVVIKDTHFKVEAPVTTDICNNVEVL